MEQGGIYVWVKKGLGEKWAARTTWYYWISLPIWLPALYIAVAEILGHMLFSNSGFWFKVVSAIMAGVFVLMTALVLLLQPGSDFAASALPVIAGTVVAVIAGEIFIRKKSAALNSGRFYG